MRLVVGAILLWGYTLVHYVHGAFLYRGYGDFFVLMSAVREWLVSGKFTAEWHLYPPLFYLLNAPLAFLSDADAARVMVVVNQGLLVVCLGLLAAIPPRTNQSAWMWVLGPLALNFRPLLLLLSMAKIELLQLALLLGALVAFQRRRPWTSGGLLGLAGMIKPLPLLLVLYFAWKCEWRVVGAWTLSVIAILVGCGVLIGHQGVWTYFSNAAMARGVNTMYWYEDQSLMGVAPRLFRKVQGGSYFLEPAEVSLVSILAGWGLRLVALGWLAYLTRPRQGVSHDLLAGEWSMAIAGMLLISPFSRDYYAVFLLPAYLLLAQHLWSDGFRWRSGAFLLGAVSYLLVGQGFPLGIIRMMPSVLPNVDNFQVYLHYGVPTVGYLLLIGAWAAAHNKLEARKSPGDPVSLVHRTVS